MAHLKKDFKFHSLFDNKYSQQTYLAYLCRDNQKYVIRTGDYIPRFIIDTMDCIIRCNNAIARRGSEKSAIENIKQIYLKTGRYYYVFSRDTSIKTIYSNVDISTLKNDYVKKIYVKLETLVSWEDKFETDFDGFKDFIYDEMQEIVNNHYCWVVGENIIYDRSSVDNLQKRVYCSLNNEKIVPKFKIMYFEDVYVEPKDKARLYKQIDLLLTTIADVNNYLLTKENVKAIELLQNYFDDNEKMETCKDIYYLNHHYQLHEVYNLISQGKNHEGLLIVQKIIEKENNKYISSFTLFESVAIDLENSTYAKIVNI